MAAGFPRPFGRYALLKPLGSGGMAEIFLGLVAGPARFRKLVAIKCLHPHLARESNFTKLFLDEARLAARLNHPNIVQTFDLGEHEDQLYMAMEYLHGVNLSQVLAAGVLPLDVALTVAIETTTGLEYAHSATDERGKPLSIIHRDVTPRNILIAYAGDVKLADFGIARAADQLHVTRTGEYKGTLRYMSPEQCGGQPIDARSDIYALGVCLFEAFTGQKLFSDLSSAKLFDPQSRMNVPPLHALKNDLPQDLDRLVRRALEPDPGRRYASCSELLDDLKAVTTSLGVEKDRECVAELLRELFPQAAGQPPLTEADEAVLRRIEGEVATSVTAAVPQPDPIPGDPEAVVVTAVTRAATPTGNLKPPSEAQLATGTEKVALDAARTARPSKLWWALAGAMSLAAVVAVVFAVRANDSPPAAKNPTASTRTPPAATAIDAQRSEVKIKIGSDPPGAVVMVDGVDEGRTPLSITRPRDPERRLNLLLQLAGHVLLRREVALDANHELQLALVPEEKPRAKRPRRGPRRRPVPAKPVAKTPPPAKAPATSRPTPRPPKKVRRRSIKVDDLK